MIKSGYIVLFLAGVFLLAACDPAVRVARVKPDRSLEIEV